MASALVEQIVSSVLHANTIAKIAIESGSCKEVLSDELGAADKYAQLMSTANRVLKPCDFENEADGTQRSISVAAGAHTVEWAQLRARFRSVARCAMACLHAQMGLSVCYVQGTLHL
jgi:hypothetical protein